MPGADDWSVGLRAVAQDLRIHVDEVEAFTVRRLIGELVRSQWPDRLSLLEEHPELVDLAVARSIAGSDEILSQFVLRAADVGLPEAKRELAVAAPLLSGFDPSTVGSIVAAIERRPGRDRTHWLLSVGVRAVEMAWGEPAADEAELRAAHLRLLALIHGVDIGDVDRAMNLAALSPDDLYNRLADGDRLGLLAGGARTWGRHLDVVGSTADARRRCSDLSAVIDRATEESPETAHAEHVSSERARALCAAGQSTTWTDDVRDALADLLSRVQNDGGSWLLDAALPLAHRAIGDIAADAPAHRDIASLVSGLFAEAVAHGRAGAAEMVRAVDLAHEAVARTDEDDPDRPLHESNLGYRIGQSVSLGMGEPAQLTESVRWHERALARTPLDDGARPLRLMHLGNRRAEAVAAGVADVNDLLEAIENLTVARASADPADEPVMYTMNWVNAVAQAAAIGLVSAEQLSLALRDAEQAVTTLASSRNGDTATHLANLSSTMSDAVRLGATAPEALRTAVSLQERVIGLQADIGPDKAWLYANLAVRHVEMVMHGLTPAVHMLDALEAAHAAVTMVDVDDSAWPGYVANLASVISDARDLGLAGEHDAEIAIELARLALDRTSVHDPERAGRESNLGSLLAERESDADREEAVVLLSAAFERITNDDDPRREMYMGNLANALADIPSRTGEAVELGRAALRLTPAGHPRRIVNVSNLAAILAEHADQGSGHAGDMVTAVGLAREAVDLLPTDHPDRTRCVANLATMIERAIDCGAMDAALAADIMAELVAEFWLWGRHGAPSPDQRRRAIEMSQCLIGAAARIVLEGRGADAAINAAESVRNCMASARRAIGLPAGASGHVADAYRQAAQRYTDAQRRFGEGIGDARDVAATVSELQLALADVRHTPGLSRFGSPPTASELACLLDDDSVAVYLITGTTTGYAVVLHSTGDAEVETLPAFTEEIVVGQANAMLGGPDAVADLAGWLWCALAEPLMARLAAAKRWFVIPTGPSAFLPFHAAGLPDIGWLDDSVEIRVLPTLSAMARPTTTPARGPTVVGISNDPDLAFLAADRAAAVEYFTDPLVLEHVTRNAVLEAMADAAVVVLSGHATPDVDGASLILDDGPLTAELLERLPLRWRDVAVLVACSSGLQSSTLVDESIGLPSALLGAGFDGVIASSWPVDDVVAFLTLVRLFQERLQGSPAPTALRAVRRWLRTVTTDELWSWFYDFNTMTALDQDLVVKFGQWISEFPSGAAILADPGDWAAFWYVGR